MAAAVRALVVLAAAAAAAGCDGFPGCAVESRALEYRAETASAPLTGTGFLELSQTRGSENADFVIWHLRAAPFAGRATTVELRQGPPGAPGRLL